VGAVALQVVANALQSRQNKCLCAIWVLQFRFLPGVLTEAKRYARPIQYRSQYLVGEEAPASTAYDIEIAKDMAFTDM